ncbi:uncharacterized protein N7482_010072 [Penicillium canariense]|uniref:SGNH hydrolase-type esterase domain-containing protein n=1 Tax=Penicillium canariense TaxID=189055 RepID=A0A9W9HLA7_9EURO|nr:uncharacterized protein N7482_010072 [Penicillium canariense]KAJ5150820.1 hypothetical protein N7482_010072 [Penicillium canariense]
MDMPESENDHWVHTWTSMPMVLANDDFPSEAFVEQNIVFGNSTLRQTMRISIGTEKCLRIRLSNAFGTEPLTITRTTLALAGGNNSGIPVVEPRTLQRVTFSGDLSTTIPGGAHIVSDSIDFGFSIAPHTALSISIYIESGHQLNYITSHPGSRTTSYFTKGDHVTQEDFQNLAVEQADHWYYISGIEALVPQDTHALALLGDSITDGRCSTTNCDTRWPNLFFQRLLSSPDSSHLISIVNQAAGGNRVLADGIGPSVLSRVDRDVLSLSGVRYVLIFTGINDIGKEPADRTRQQTLNNQLIAGYKQLVTRLRAHGLWVFGATLTPFCLRNGNDPSSYSHPQREATRQSVNQWIRTSGTFDAVVDFDSVLRDSKHSAFLKEEFDSGDGLHPNEWAFGAMASAFDVSLLSLSV